MLERYLDVWLTFGEVISALPDDVVTVVCTFFCLIGVVGILSTI